METLPKSLTKLEPLQSLLDWIQADFRSGAWKLETYREIVLEDQFDAMIKEEMK
tara:strand:+ start:4016 stop:4177 length:162 start_codon:yes stop_codon:yes gene_type:complete